MTIAMLSLAGFPATAGFFGKIYLIEAAVDNQYAFLGVAIVLGSALSLAYYLRVVAAVWLAAPDESRAPAPLVSPARARRSPAGPRRPTTRRASGSACVGSEQLEVVILAVVCAIATVGAGDLPRAAVRRRQGRGRGARRSALGASAKRSR